MTLIWADGGTIEIWSAETLDAAPWQRLELAPVKNPYTGQLEFRIPTEASQVQRFYRLEIQVER